MHILLVRCALVLFCLCLPLLAQQQASPAPQARTVAPTPPAQGRGGTPTPAVATTVAAPAARRTTQPINVKVDLSITDQHAGSPPIKRTLSVIVADGYTGSIVAFAGSADKDPARGSKAPFARRSDRG